MLSLKEAQIEYERDMTKLMKDIQDTKFVIAKFQREMSMKPNDDVLRAQTELLQDRLK